MSSATTRSEAGFLKRFPVHFGWVFFGLYFFPFPLNYLPFMGWLSSGWKAMWKAAVVWSGAHVLRLPQPILYEPTGSGDTLHDWVFIGMLIVLSALIAVLWSILSRGRKAHPELAAGLRVFLRYALAGIMLSYGLSKVFDIQFSPPGRLLLTQSLGGMTPMMLAWTFMGYSVPYTIFAGALECLGGLLLLFRRTAVLGALVTAVVMTNVVMMNLCYDIPVKLHSSLYLVIAMAILAPSMKRLVDLLVFHRPVEPEEILPHQGPAWQRRLWLSVKTLLAGWIICSNAWANWSEWHQYRAAASSPQGPVEGFFEIRWMARNGVEVPRLYTDGAGWRWVAIGKEYLRVATVDGSRLPSSRFSLDEGKRTIILLGWTGPKTGSTEAPKGELVYAWADPRHLDLKGTLDGAAVELRLEKREVADFPLMNRGFHWISEHPYTQAN